MCNRCHSTSDSRALQCALREAETSAARAAACARAAEKAACSAQKAAARADAALEKVRCLIEEMNQSCYPALSVNTPSSGCGCRG